MMRAAQQRLHLTRAFGAPLYRAFLHLLGVIVSLGVAAQPARAGEPNR